jgi:hypothetical protein
MNVRFDRRSMLALAAAGAVGLALPSCFSEAKGDEPDELTEYGYDPDVPEPGTVEAPGRPTLLTDSGRRTATARKSAT